MNQQELELAGKIISEMKNATGYSYDILVRGTALDGIISTIVFVVATIAAALIAVYVFKYTEKCNVTARYESDKFPPEWASVIAFVVCVVIFAIIGALIGDSVLHIVAPEYVVVKSIIEAAV
jgi:SNF family Na+-dependent transporter